MVCGLVLVAVAVDLSLPLGALHKHFGDRTFCAVRQKSKWRPSERHESWGIVGLARWKYHFETNALICSSYLWTELVSLFTGTLIGNWSGEDVVYSQPLKYMARLLMGTYRTVFERQSFHSIRSLAYIPIRSSRDKEVGIGRRGNIFRNLYIRSLKQCNFAQSSFEVVYGSCPPRPSLSISIRERRAPRRFSTIDLRPRDKAFEM